MFCDCAASIVLPARASTTKPNLGSTHEGTHSDRRPRIGARVAQPGGVGGRPLRQTVPARQHLRDPHPDPGTGSFSGDATGVASHLGRFTASQHGAVAPAPDGHYAGRSTWKITAANGDTLTGTATLDVQGSPAGEHTTTMVSTITGGTGRFDDAKGTFTIVAHVTPISFDGVTAVNRAEGTIAGRISY